MKQEDSQRWFDRASQIDIIPYLERYEGLEFHRSNKKALCPFHDDTNPTLSVRYKGRWFYKCFSCNASGDLVKFVRERHGKSAIDAVKEILSNDGYDIGEAKLSDAELEERKEKNRAWQKAQDTKIKKRKEKEKKEFLVAQKNMMDIAPRCAEALHVAVKENDEEIVKAWIEHIPHFYNLDDGVISHAMGYDEVQKSVCFIIQDDNGKVFNIKHREKFVWDKKNKCFLEERMKGKWLGQYNGGEYPFGYHFFDDDKRVVICEGEKDVLNLRSIGVNAVTLGGVSCDWEKWKHLLAGKDVFVWFDHDKAGYAQSFVTYESIKDACASVQIVMFFKLGHYHDKFDMSDFLADERITMKDALFKRIIYSSFLPNNYLIQELLEHLRLDGEELSEKESQLKEHFDMFMVEVKSREFDDIKEDILKSVKMVRGTLDKEIAEYEKLYNQMVNSDNRKVLKDTVVSLLPDDNEYLRKELRLLADAIGVKAKLLNKIRGNKVHDTFHELINAAKRVGFDFAKYRGGFYIYTGSHYAKFASEYPQFQDFIFQQFFRACKLDFSSQNVDNAKKVEENIIAYSPSLEPLIDTSVRVMNMRNGTLIVRKSGKIIFRNTCRKEDCALNTLPFDYEPEAKAPKWDAFLDRVLPNKKDQEALGEFMGYVILPSNRFEKFLILYGPTGANGKSVVLDTIADFFHKDNVSHLQLEKFEGHDLEILPNKILNIGGEIQSSGDLRKQLSTLKLLTDNLSSISINPKHEKPFAIDVEEKPKMAFATNDLPRSGADDGGVLRRMLLLHFSEEIKDKEKIRDLVRRMEDDKPGILNFALEGLARLIRNGRFTQSDEMGQFMEEYKDDLNHVRAYANECLISQPNVIVPKKFIYAHYTAWADSKGIQKPYSNNIFFSKLKKQTNFKEVQKSRMEITAQDKRIVQGQEVLIPVTLNAGRCFENIAIDASVLGGVYEVDNYKVNSSAFSTLKGIEMTFEREKEAV